MVVVEGLKENAGAGVMELGGAVQMRGVLVSGLHLNYSSVINGRAELRRPQGRCIHAGAVNCED